MKATRKIIGVLLTAALLFAAVSVAFSVSAATSGIYTYEVSNGEAVITKCSDSASGSITIPSTLGGYPVTKIGDGAFFCCTNITKVIIPNSVITIDTDAFSFCDSLVNVTIGNSVKKIGSEAFSACSSLTNITIPKSVTTVYGDSFNGCASLTEINVDKDNAYFSSDEYGVLYNKNKSTLIRFPMSCRCTSYVIPNSTTIIDEYSFSSCNNLREIVIPDSVTRIHEGAFSAVSSLEKLTMPISIIMCSESYMTFYLTSNIKEIILTSGNGIMQDFTTYSYKTCLFYKNTPWGQSSGVLESIEIRDGVKYIGNSAFYNCKVLKSIPDSIETIGEYAFYGCTGLEGTISLNTVSVKANAFNACTSVDKFIFNKPDCFIYDDNLTIPQNAIICGYKNSTAQEYAEKYNRDFVALDADECDHLNTEKQNFADASCMQNGYTGDIYCSDCGILISEGEIIPAINHINATTINAKPATCVEEGYTGDIYCTDCKNIVSNGEPIEKVSHTYAIDKSVPPSCTETGITDGLHCSVCNTILIEQEEIPAIGHTAPNEYGKCETCATLVVAGDVDGDGVISMRDTVMINRYIVDGCKYDPSGYAISLDGTLADVNGDGKVSMLDTVMISRFVVDGGKTDPNGYNISLAPIG